MDVKRERSRLMLLLAAVGLAAATFAALTGAVDEAVADPKSERQLAGRWEVLSTQRGGEVVPLPEGVAIMLELRLSDHFFRMVVRTPQGGHHEQGRWKLEGDVLTTTTDAQRKVEQILVRFVERGRLELRKEDEILLLRRL